MAEQYTHKKIKKYIKYAHWYVVNADVVYSIDPDYLVRKGENLPSNPNPTKYAVQALSDNLVAIYESVAGGIWVLDQYTYVGHNYLFKTLTGDRYLVYDETVKDLDGNFGDFVDPLVAEALPTSSRVRDYVADGWLMFPQIDKVTQAEDNLMDRTEELYLTILKNVTVKGSTDESSIKNILDNAGIAYTDTDDLEHLRDQAQILLSLRKQPYTMAFLRGFLDAIIGLRNYRIITDFDHFRITIHVINVADFRWTTVLSAMRMIIPYNMLWTVIAYQNMHKDLEDRRHFYYEQFTHRVIEDDPSII